ncbi:hypothetical protein QO002_005201 [Pararhizobium capsulatum DSM 1112]|uniref:Uncharacterized protein n=1 Tax=Pararhizobium capsulatum DSM 1112 TaxID=1121113 RepID=A0ABU0BXK1_9HYPH|nr:hypothetical protein [Pararhizobium capsulatum]MDQ0322995.1 hypothetical protein [Pararhizobium capsulatum DSM 1112]
MIAKLSLLINVSADIHKVMRPLRATSVLAFANYTGPNVHSHLWTDLLDILFGGIPMRNFGSLVLVASVSATFAAVPISMDLKSPWTFSTPAALAGNGNGGGKGGGGGHSGGGGNGGGSGKSETHASAGHEKAGSSSRHKSGTNQSNDTIATAFGKLFGTHKGEEKRAGSKKSLSQTTKGSPKAEKSILKVAKPTPRPENRVLVTKAYGLGVDASDLNEKSALPAKLGRLNSLNRNYHAYLNSDDPHMAAIRDYVVAYAQFELDNGRHAIPTDPALSDEALSAALLSAANKDIGVIGQPGDVIVADPEVMAWAKTVLGVGPAVGKIDQVRNALAIEQPTDHPPTWESEADLVREDYALDVDAPDLNEQSGLAAKLGRLNSLNRNYHAYLNSNDPHMSAIRDYVVSYAQFELENGDQAIPSDPALSDDALSAALLSAANKDIGTIERPGDVVVVDPEVIAWAKDVLGVGPAVGKIDQVRDVLATE